MVEVRDQRRQERAEARAGRRSDDGESSDGPGIDLKRAITTAAAAAVVGGLAGAAKAFADRQGRSSHSEAVERPPEPSSQADEHDEPQEDPAEQPDEEPSAEQQDEEPSADQQEEEPEEEEQEQEQQPEPAAAPSGDVAKVIARARKHVEQVLGEEPEGVSGINRTNGNWCVDVEIVKLHRIPESTDVLASYAVVVDGDGDLVSLQETRRYRRSQAEEDR